MVAALVIQGLVIAALLWFIRDLMAKHRQREDELLTWVKDTPTAVVRADTGIRELIEASVMDDDEMVKREAKYEPETAAAGSDDG